MSQVVHSCRDFMTFQDPSDACLPEGNDVTKLITRTSEDFDGSFIVIVSINLMMIMSNWFTACLLVINKIPQCL